MGVEVGSSTLAAGDNAVPETVWYTDGEQLAKKARLGKAKATVAALGPRVTGQPLSGSDKRVLQSRAYELRANGRKYVGSVVTFGGRTICTTVSQVAPAQEGQEVRRIECWTSSCFPTNGSRALIVYRA